MSQVKLVFVTPYITEEYQKRHLENLSDKYDGIIYPGLEKIPYKFAISARNKWMVEQADVVIFYIDHTWGGAYSAYIHAKRKGKQIINFGNIM